jgi:UDP-glucose 4-epimerase
MNIFVTGAAGYIGGMLAERFLDESKIKNVMALDIKPAPEFFPISHKKVTWIQHNLGDEGWEEKILRIGMPDVLIHCAYIIRQQYGKNDRAWQYKSNIIAADRVFDFVFKNNIKRLIHYSTAASYGAFLSNSPDKKFKEDDGFRETNYLYAEEKRLIEDKLKSVFEELNPKTQVLIIRPAAVSGPRGQFMYDRFGLLYAVKEGFPVVPVTWPESARQFIHEDDIWEASKFMSFGGVDDQYEVFNLAPEDYFLLKDLAKEIGKPVVRIPVWLGRFAYGSMWHLSRGKIPTPPTGINSYSYPVILDGSKITNLDFKYRYSGKDALKAKSGYYMKYVQR